MRDLRRLWRPEAMDETWAWSCLATNLAVLPGLGSVIAGRKAGFAQAALALAGFVLSLVWFASFVTTWIRLGELPLDGGPHFAGGLWGVALFGLAWLWSLASGLALVREARRRAAR